MISHTITNLKLLMSDLLVKDVFHVFLLREAALTTYCSLYLDGACHRDFYDTGEGKEPGEKYASEEEFVPWEKVRPLCYSFIKGKQLPLKMNFVFHAPGELMRELLKKEAKDFPPELAGGLAFTLRYERGKAAVTTGLALNGFTMDRSLERAWDKYMTGFLEPYLSDER